MTKPPTFSTATRELMKDSLSKPRKKSGPLARVAKPVADQSSDEAVRQWASLFDQVSDAIIAKTIDGRIAAWNSAAERMFGYSAAEIEALAPKEHAA